MIVDKQMKYILSDKGMDYYIFSPTLFRQYFNKKEEWTPHRQTITHKIHMFLYHIRCGYNILYVMDNDDIAGYLIYTRGGFTVIKNTTRKDVFTIFVTTHPNHRRKNIATNLVNKFLHEIGIEYDTSYKTIYDHNLGSIKAALANGYDVVYSAKKTRLFQTIVPDNENDWKLYSVKSIDRKSI